MLAYARFCNASLRRVLRSEYVIARMYQIMYHLSLCRMQGADISGGGGVWDAGARLCGAPPGGAAGGRPHAGAAIPGGEVPGPGS